MLFSDWSSDVCSSDLRLIAAVGDVLFRLLNRIVAGVVDAVMVDLGAPVGHPVGDHLAGARAVLDPDRHAVPQAAHIRRLADGRPAVGGHLRSEEHTSELQSLMRISYAVFCLTKKKLH